MKFENLISSVVQSTARDNLKNKRFFTGEKMSSRDHRHVDIAKVHRIYLRSQRSISYAGRRCHQSDLCHQQWVLINFRGLLAQFPSAIIFIYEYVYIIYYLCKQKNRIEFRLYTPIVHSQLMKHNRLRFVFQISFVTDGIYICSLILYICICECFCSIFIFVACLLHRGDFIFIYLFLLLLPINNTHLCIA